MRRGAVGLSAALTEKIGERSNGSVALTGAAIRTHRSDVRARLKQLDHPGLTHQAAVVAYHGINVSQANVVALSHFD